MSRAKYVLTYTENTDAGDPASLTKNRFFCIKENAVAAMETAFIAVDNIMHFSDRTTDDMHYISRTETSIYVCDGIDTMSWAIEEIVAEDRAEKHDDKIERMDLYGFRLFAISPLAR